MMTNSVLPIVFAAVFFAVTFFLAVLACRRASPSLPQPQKQSTTTADGGGGGDNVRTPAGGGCGAACGGCGGGCGG